MLMGRYSPRGRGQESGFEGGVEGKGSRSAASLVSRQERADQHTVRRLVELSEVVAAEPPPVVVQLAAQLADPGRRQAKALAQIAGALAGHHAVEDPARAPGLRFPPRREVDAEAHLLGDR